MELLSLSEAVKWIQIGFCFTIGAGAAYLIGWILAELIFKMRHA